MSKKLSIVMPCYRAEEYVADIGGYGEVDTDWYLSNMSSLAIGPHNFVYTVLLRGGVILLSVMVTIFVTALKPLLQHDLMPFSLRLLLGIQVWLVMALMEVYPTFFILYLLALAFYYPKYTPSSKPLP